MRNFSKSLTRGRGTGGKAPPQMLYVPRMPGQLYARGQKVLMRYSDQLDLNDAVTGFASVEYRMNNIYDPYQTGVGHQPISYDQWASLYDSYVVYGASASLQAIANGGSATSQIPSTVALTVKSNGASITNIDTLLEHPTTVFCTLGPNESGSRTISTGYIDMADIVGKRGITWDASEWGAKFGSSPTNEIHLQVTAHANDGTTVNVNAVLVIEYYVWIYEPVDLLGS